MNFPTTNNPETNSSKQNEWPKSDILSGNSVGCTQSSRFQSFGTKTGTQSGVLMVEDPVNEKNYSQQHDWSEPLALEQMTDLNRWYLSSLLKFVNGLHPEIYHNYRHYLQIKEKEKWTEKEKIMSSREDGPGRTCRLCGCTRRLIKIRSKKVKKVKRKYLFSKCGFCGKITKVTKEGLKPPKSARSKKTKDDLVNLSVPEKPQSKPKPKSKSNAGDKVETFEHQDTIKQLNFLLKGGKGGKKLNAKDLSKSRLMDLLL